LCARNEKKAFAAINKLKEVTGKDNVHFLKLDLADIPSCAAAAQELLAKEPKIDILFLNA
jgi:retinol dehydrogenase 12